MVRRKRSEKDSRVQFRIAHVNARSIRPRTVEIGRFVVQHKIDILAVQESWLEGDEKVTLPGFYWVGRGREGRQGEVPVS